MLTNIYSISSFRMFSEISIVILVSFEIKNLNIPRTHIKEAFLSWSLTESALLTSKILPSYFYIKLQISHNNFYTGGDIFLGPFSFLLNLIWVDFFQTIFLKSFVTEISTNFWRDFLWFPWFSIQILMAFNIHWIGLGIVQLINGLTL